MGLKTTVKVGSITNLSDARYCAGMGVDLLGFNAVPGNPDYILPIQFQELRGWFVGPEVVIEVYRVDQPKVFEELLHNYQPDMVELSCHELLKLRPREIPVILRIEPEQFHSQAAVLRDYKSIVRYLQLPANIDESLLTEIMSQYKVLIEAAENDSFIELVSRYPQLGLALKGSDEERAGFKNYDQLASVLEQLEED
ncbi:MAG: hypothetical protein KF687_11930 [Cyclobacteriaceae bacterium]|nr:hypothetical protein [Cyclobacteriaceae bacterium]